MNKPLSMGVLTDNIVGWHKARNLIDGSTDQAQFVKLIEEIGELAGNIARGKDVKDDIGDAFVVLCNIATRNGVTMDECVQTAWDDIKHRKGRMENGVFIKEEDLEPETITIIPSDATHVNSSGQYIKKQGNFWCVFVDDAWKVMSGEPIGLESLE